MISAIQRFGESGVAPEFVELPGTSQYTSPAGSSSFT